MSSSPCNFLDISSILLDVENGMIMLLEFHKKTLDFFENRKDLKFLSIMIETPQANHTVANFLNIPWLPWSRANQGKRHNFAKPIVRVREDVVLKRLSQHSKAKANVSRHILVSA
jgi:hypothetical protein